MIKVGRLHVSLNGYTHVPSHILTLTSYTHTLTPSHTHTLTHTFVRSKMSQYWSTWQTSRSSTLMTLAWWDMWGVWCVRVCDVIYVGNTGMVRCVRVWVYQDNRRERVMHWRNGACNLAYLVHSNTNQLTKLCHSALSGNNELCKVNVLSSTCAQWVVVRASSEREVLALTFSSFWSEDKTYHWWPNFISFFLCTGLSYRVSLFGKWVFHQPCSDKVV